MTEAIAFANDYALQFEIRRIFMISRRWERSDFAGVFLSPGRK